jgi:hypothetical protein
MLRDVLKSLDTHVTVLATEELTMGVSEITVQVNR